MQKILPTLLLLLLTKFTIAQNVDVVDVKKFKALAKDKATEFLPMQVASMPASGFQPMPYLGLKFCKYECLCQFA